MTNPSTETIVLDDEAVARLELIMTSGDSQAMYEAANVDNVRALCQTVRVLRAEMKTQKVELLQLSGRGELLAKVHVNFDDLDPLAAVRNEFDRLRNIVIRDLQSQLEQTEARLKLITEDRNLLYMQVKDLRAENERLKEHANQIERDARDDAQAASNETRWQERLGEDYGSY